MTWQETEHNWMIPILFLQGKILLFVKQSSDVQVRLGDRILSFSLKFWRSYGQPHKFTAWWILRLVKNYSITKINPADVQQVVTTNQSGGEGGGEFKEKEYYK